MNRRHRMNDLRQQRRVESQNSENSTPVVSHQRRPLADPDEIIGNVGEVSHFEMTNQTVKRQPSGIIEPPQSHRNFKRPSGSHSANGSRVIANPEVLTAMLNFGLPSRPKSIVLCEFPLRSLSRHGIDPRSSLTLGGRTRASRFLS